MTSKKISVLISAAVLGLSACTVPPTQEQSGMVIGGALGGVLGSQVGGGEGRTVATIVGTLVGASIGGAVGRSMDDQDRIKVARSLETVRTGVASQWRNPDTGNEYTVVPTRTYDSAGAPCREYTVNATIGGKREKVYGTACRQRDGSWRTAG
ncbi:RT0821/Lpp0805 family surface protein [Noviherbaspirillum sp. UKPF54]|uniref:RT0821/Lpp0805 family surface protein n=1 Tax=Noviherbaspirillum sp. UKPF54 TaxID=2601898 RepID=UPI0011B12C60|nr:RT0821/Lpp0805 family surface protein [Noviherbaspirillum sp. UKPF54]QDZ27850.1 glycine zipper 2TM domain-containing protein [Noviherbaspirillum sp. UKPF54]